jgi:hypothetical protein
MKDRQIGGNKTRSLGHTVTRSVGFEIERGRNPLYCYTDPNILFFIRTLILTISPLFARLHSYLLYRSDPPPPLKRLSETSLWTMHALEEISLRVRPFVRRQQYAQWTQETSIAIAISIKRAGKWDWDRKTRIWIFRLVPISKSGSSCWEDRNPRSRSELELELPGDERDRARRRDGSGSRSGHGHGSRYGFGNGYGRSEERQR